MKRWNKKSYAHKLVAELQISMAHELYDALCSKPHGEGDKFYKEWRETEFVNMVAPTLRDQARGLLAQMLETNIPEREKQEIYQALLLDKVIPNEDRWHIPASGLIQ